MFGTGIADDATLDYLSRLIGEERRTEYNQSGDLYGGRRSISETTQYRRTAPADTIRRVERDHALLVYGRDLPAQVELRPWFEHYVLSAQRSWRLSQQRSLASPSRRDPTENGTELAIPHPRHSQLSSV